MDLPIINQQQINVLNALISDLTKQVNDYTNAKKEALKFINDYWSFENFKNSCSGFFSASQGNNLCTNQNINWLLSLKQSDGSMADVQFDNTQFGLQFKPFYDYMKGYAVSYTNKYNEATANLQITKTQLDEAKAQLKQLMQANNSAVDAITHQQFIQGITAFLKDNGLYIAVAIAIILIVYLYFKFK